MCSTSLLGIRYFLGNSLRRHFGTRDKNPRCRPTFFKRIVTVVVSFCQEVMSKQDNADATKENAPVRQLQTTLDSNSSYTATVASHKRSDDYLPANRGSPRTKVHKKEPIPVAELPEFVQEFWREERSSSIPTLQQKLPCMFPCKTPSAKADCTRTEDTQSEEYKTSPCAEEVTGTEDLDDASIKRTKQELHQITDTDDPLSTTREVMDKAIKAPKESVDDESRSEEGEGFGIGEPRAVPKFWCDRDLYNTVHALLREFETLESLLLELCPDRLKTLEDLPGCVQNSEDFAALRALQLKIGERSAGHLRSISASIEAMKTCLEHKLMIKDTEF